MRQIAFHRIALVIAGSFVAGCAMFAPQFEAGRSCQAAAFAVDDQFDGARRGMCQVLGDTHVQLNIVPEDSGYINDSAWFAFRLTPVRATTAVVELRYRGGHHRYHAKTSRDGANWVALPESAITVNRSGRRATLQVPLGDQPVYVAGQALVMPAADERWLRNVAQRSGASTRVLGTSVGGQSISALESGANKRDVIMLVGRQHPPEVTGSYGMKPFVETVMGDTPLAQRFRQRFGVIAMPMLNPDGVKAGHWRHNLGGIDLNRDWGPFSQPETLLALELLDQIDDGGRRLHLFLDFHSTRKNVFYTQPDHDVSEPTDFALRWLDQARPHLTNYEFSHERRHNAGLPTSKNYVNERFGIPAITYEVGDETTPAAAANAAVIFAQQMMHILLASPE